MLKRSVFVRSLAAVLLALVATGSALAQSAADANVDAVPLSLEQALRIALENNLDLIIARKDPQVAAQQVEIEAAPFDGVLGAFVQYADTDDTLDITDDQTGISAPGTDTAEVMSAGASWSDLMHFGGRYSVSLDPRDVESRSRSVSLSTGFFQDFAFDSTNYPLLLRYEMPLLKNFGTEVNTERLVLAQNSLAMSEEQLRIEAHRVLQAVERAYWDVVAATEALRTENFALKRADDLLGLNRKKVEVGTLAPIEITQAEAGVASQLEGVIVAETTLQNAEDELRRLLAVPPQDPSWSRPIAATDRPRFDEQGVDVEQATATALELRPEVLNAQRELANTELSERVAKRQKRHELNLLAEATPSDAEDSRTQSQQLPDSSIFTSVTTTDTDGLNWRVGLNYTLPIHNRQANANFAVASINRERAALALQNTEQTVRVEVRQAARNVESGIKRVAAARKNVELQQEKLEAEQKKFENGMSTSFEVLTFQNDLADAELSLIRAGLDYVTALTELERAKGTLLEARGLTLDPDE